MLGARRHYERALRIYEKTLGPGHPETNRARSNLANLCLADGAPSEALSLAEAALRALEKVLGADHPSTKGSALVAASALESLGRATEASALRSRFGIEAELAQAVRDRVVSD